MKQAQQFNLFDPCSGEGSATFTVLEDGRVEIASTSHPDLPVDVEVVSVEKGRETWRWFIAQGWVQV